MPSVKHFSPATTLTEETHHPTAVPARRLLVAASGTGGHLFPALAVAEKLSNYQIEWLGVPDRLETRLVPADYPLHTIGVQGFQQKLSLRSVTIGAKLVRAVFQVRSLLQQGKFGGVLTTGGYIAAPAIIAGRSLGLPTILHESNAWPGKVTRWLSPWCHIVALGFEAAAQHLPPAKAVYVGTPVRAEFLQASRLELAVPPDVPLLVVAGGSQGAVAINRLVRQCAPTWLNAGLWIVHLTGDQDPEVNSLQHPHYLPMPFYQNMAPLLHRANLAISRAGAGTLTELAVTGTPAILIPYPYAAEDHQSLNAAVFAASGAALVFQETDLTAQRLEQEVSRLLRSPQALEPMAQQTASLAVTDSAERLAALVRRLMEPEAAG
ncbi:MAG TPA: undecaprenyldiphospho-muramoylpentapeptide beta-N-acetylglucosaminyltransferase [Candidatus Caenarcaniphilales bacterium]